MGVCGVNCWNLGRENIISVLEKVKPFEIPVKQVEYEGALLDKNV